MTWGIKTTRCLLRRVIYVAMRVCYRLSVHGQEHVPKRGAALVVCNHVSFMDALVLGGGSPRSLRFVMDQPIFESRWLKWWFQLVGAIPVESERHSPGALRRTLDEVSKALREGDVVMVFPEGRLTPDGDIHTFRRGLETILARDNVPVIPAGLAGLWGSWTSHYGGKALKKWPSRFRAPVSLHFGPPILVHEVEGVALRRFLEQRVRALKAAGDSEIARCQPRQQD
ncbi:1-acyl-sn-glycerol-3-phosphate acyltransferase [Vreelandella aquamarina]|uniref:Phospholipid/glycerol acyltransferase domain-containing protein n=1 Tax=Vreelandella aquamarina TaxID=77097 RepID=A0A6F8SRR1_9GAMM|nr:MULTISPECIES: 1-acyl-sn-glycerol-3-phosphate acyltransferase [Halomonas]MEC8901148.1 1-acyl-sn-glycerol-3-phosphate acyltransferase [Pseudomonadota bacterium]MAD21333.1 1-acyl-sn-glycerol-3-phosphate acyltransferase [Halomonas sp.]MCC4286328.1 1-acyl-sn-glycerol-3-phosphate acyltransferase [Halomonas meridiana]MEC9021490.1 1-acyl-sn-glycerol-3-phosphate acyltransferase [Pseudomonadota bacterium]MEC9304870.1 1-acyl-sn-glycerol-3-phosphate acyltransferase [Pseudomonadota bacterium]